MQTGHGRSHVHPGQNHQNAQLGTVAVWHSEQLMQPKAHLGGEKTDGPDGAGHHGNHTEGIDDTTEAPLNDFLTEYRVQQRSWLQRFALSVVGPRQDQGCQGAEHGPCQESPVRERLGHGGSDRCGGASFGIKSRRRNNKVVNRFTSGKKHPASGQQGTHDHRQPPETADFWSIQSAYPSGAGPAQGCSNGDEECE